MTISLIGPLLVHLTSIKSREAADSFMKLVLESSYLKPQKLIVTICNSYLCIASLLIELILNFDSIKYCPQDGHLDTKLAPGQRTLIKSTNYPINNLETTTKFPG